MPSRPLVLAALALPALVACAGPTPVRIEPPVALGSFPVLYEARVAGPGSPDRAGIRIEDHLPTEAPDSMALPAFEVGCKLVRMDAEAAALLFGWSPADGVARTLNVTRVRELLETEALADRIMPVDTPSLLLVDGQRGVITVCNQTAYISHFDLEMADGIAVADPAVRVATDGIFLDLLPTARPGGLAVTLDLVLELADLRQPIPVVEATMPGSSSPISFQQPILCTQKLTTSAALTPEECLVLTAFDGKDADGRLFAFVTARHLDRAEVEAMGSETVITPR